MSKGKKLALFAGLILILAAAVIVIAVLQSNGVLQTGEESSEESSFTVEDEYLLQHEKTEIASIQVRNSAAEYTLISKLTESQDSSGNQTTQQSWNLKDHEDWELTTSAVSSLASIGSALKSTSTIAEKKAEVDLANFGLDKPYAELTVTYTDGSSVVVSLGDTTPDGSYRYAMLSDRDGIYTVYKSVATYAEYDLTNLREITIEQINVEEELDYLLLEKKGSRPIEVGRWADGEKHEGIYDSSVYKFLQPYTWNASVVTGNISDMFAEYASVSVEKLIEADAADLDKYGLGENSFEHHVKVTTRAEVADSNDSSSENSSAAEAKKTYEYHTADYYFGKSASDDGSMIYFRQGGSKDVYTVKASSLDCFNFDAFEYLQKLVFLYNIQDLDGYTVSGTANGKTYEASILRQNESEISSVEDSSAERLEVFYINGSLVDDSAFKKQYQRVIGVAIDYEITSEEGKPAYDPKDKITLEYHFSDGTSHTVEFYRLNEFYYVTPWGDSWMACNAKQFDDMWDGFAAFEE